MLRRVYQGQFVCELLFFFICGSCSVLVNFRLRYRSYAEQVAGQAAVRSPTGEVSPASFGQTTPGMLLGACWTCMTILATFMNIGLPCAAQRAKSARLRFVKLRRARFASFNRGSLPVNVILSYFWPATRSPLGRSVVEAAGVEPAEHTVMTGVNMELLTVY